MKKSKKMKPIAIAASLAFSATAAMAATTPYDLIRPTWPLSWDAKVFENFDTTVTKKTGMLPKEATPASFKAGAMMPDTLDQAYFDAINTKISPIRMNQAGYLKSDTERQF
jgi:spermidine/putrescine-binding protein